ncbi:uncharacterized protein LOC116341193 isoform X2 [Contarinia nasturtii]|uniref:uncharacterized protein LOC116341193 isoform X2 n=1 Tax=Contarinia nasturtii TaxID=265458 RepID=UPI0012D42892|nr:uncharacterized protein LOC116341193 isoform X2 [Contarinia nasturtii]
MVSHKLKMDNYDAKVIGWFGVVMNPILLFIFEGVGIAGDFIAGTFVFNLIGCLIWLVGISLNLTELLVTSLIWLAMPLMCWSFYISFQAHQMLFGHGSTKSLEHLTHFWVTIFMFAFCSIYVFIALKNYRENKKTGDATQRESQELV